MGMRSAKNDPCYCQSGAKYKDCHLKFDSMPPKYRLQTAQQIYKTKWSKNAKNFAAQRCYIWMAAQVLKSRPQLLLDIGCGEGSGILALLAEANGYLGKLIAIDENIDCLLETKNKLVKAGYSVQLVDQMEAKVVGDKHRYEFQALTAVADAQVVLVHTDVLHDPSLAPWLQGIGQFDAVTVWLNGTHSERRNCIQITAASPGDYRLQVQNATYELSDRILRLGGVLQVVDRGEPPNTRSRRDDLQSSHSEQALSTTLVIEDVDYLLYNEIDAKTNVRMVATPGTDGLPVDMSQLAVISVISRKH